MQSVIPRVGIIYSGVELTIFKVHFGNVAIVAATCTLVYGINDTKKIRCGKSNAKIRYGTDFMRLTILLKLDPG